MVDQRFETFLYTNEFYEYYFLVNHFLVVKKKRVQVMVQGYISQNKNGKNDSRIDDKL